MNRAEYVEERVKLLAEGKITEVSELDDRYQEGLGLQ